MATADDGARLLEAGDVAGAVAALHEAATANPGDARSRGLYGIALARAGHNDLAIQELRTAADLSPDDPAAHRNLGVALMRAGRNDEARKALARSVELDPTNKATADALASLSATPPAATQPAASTPTDSGLAAGVAAPAEDSSATHAPSPGMAYTPPPPSHGPMPPPMATRLARGAAWGAAFGQVWTGLVVFWDVIFHGHGNTAGFVITVTIVLAIFFALVGAVMGLIMAATNASVRAGLGIGIGFGLALMVLELLLSQSPMVLVNIIFWVFTGRYIGAKVAWKIQQPV